MRYKIIIWVSVFVALLGNALAQDIHFSQFYSTPLLLNPANAGYFHGDYRLITNYKSQWAGVTSPYKTMAAQFDAAFLRDAENTRFLGAGLSVYNDKAGDSKMGILQVNGMASYNLRVARKHEVSAGMSVGYSQRSIATGGLKWDDQYDGYQYNASTSSGEMNGIAYRFFDMGAGATWHFHSDNYHKFNAGIAVLHANGPKQSYLADYSVRLPRKYVLQGGGTIKIKGTNKYIVPYLLYTLQNRQWELTGGSLFKYVLGNDSRYTDANVSSAIYFGAFYRVRDAFIIATRLDYKNYFSVGVSYDINVSKLTTVSTFRGGPEITLSYSGFYKVFAGHKKAASI